MNQLVLDRVAELRVAAAERQRDAALEIFGDAQNAFRRHERQHVRLLEIRMRRVHDQRDAMTDRVVEPPLELHVRALRIGE